MSQTEDMLGDFYIRGGGLLSLHASGREQKLWKPRTGWGGSLAVKPRTRTSRLTQTPWACCLRHVRGWG